MRVEKIVSYGVISGGIIDGRDLGGEQIDLRAAEGNQGDGCHLVLKTKSRTADPRQVQCPGFS